MCLGVHPKEVSRDVFSRGENFSLLGTPKSFAPGVSQRTPGCLKVSVKISGLTI